MSKKKKSTSGKRRDSDAERAIELYVKYQGSKSAMDAAGVLDEYESKSSFRVINDFKQRKCRQALNTLKMGPNRPYSFLKDLMDYGKDLLTFSEFYTLYERVLTGTARPTSVYGESRYYKYYFSVTPKGSWEEHPGEMAALTERVRARVIELAAMANDMTEEELEKNNRKWYESKPSRIRFEIDLVQEVFCSKAEKILLNQKEEIQAERQESAPNSITPVITETEDRT